MFKHAETKFERAMRSTREARDYLEQILSGAVRLSDLTIEELLEHILAVDALMNTAQRKLSERLLPTRKVDFEALVRDEKHPDWPYIIDKFQRMA